MVLTLGSDSLVNVSVSCPLLPNHQQNSVLGIIRFQLISKLNCSYSVAYFFRCSSNS